MNFSLIVLSILMLGIVITSKDAKAETTGLISVAGHLPDLQFTLVDDEGVQVNAERYQNEIVLLYFGFTGCSSQCPAVMARLDQWMGAMQNNQVTTRLLFVTVDPANDTPSILHRYIARFKASHMTGLTGTPAAIETLAKRYRAVYRPQSAMAGDIAHSNAVYVFDKHGKARLLLLPQDTMSSAMHDLMLLAQED